MVPVFILYPDDKCGLHLAYESFGVMGGIERQVAHEIGTVVVLFCIKT